jgi:hypothetical protein
MTRHYSGNRDDSNKVRKTASQMFQDAKKMGKSFYDMSSEERFQYIMEDKLNHLRADEGKSKYGFHLPGTKKEDKELSASAKKAIEQRKQKQAKADAKKQKEQRKVLIVSKYFTGPQGGRIDKSGHIYNASGQHVYTVDKETGKIKTKQGNTVGKYEAHSPFSEYRIQQLIAKSNTQKRGFAALYEVGGNNGSTNGGGAVAPWDAETGW